MALKGTNKMTMPDPEFSRVISVSRISPHGVEEHLEAKPAEREALAKRFDLLAVPMLKARVALMPGSGQAITAQGLLEAEVVQCCVATLEPLTSRLAADIHVVFMPEEAGKESSNPPFDDREDEYEFYKGGKIDLGEMVAQHLGVSIDLYPRKEGAAPVAAEFGAKPAQTRPFATLPDVIRIDKKANKNKGKQKGS